MRRFLDRESAKRTKLDDSGQSKKACNGRGAILAVQGVDASGVRRKRLAATPKEYL